MPVAVIIRCESCGGYPDQETRRARRRGTDRARRLAPTLGSIFAAPGS